MKAPFRYLVYREAVMTLKYLKSTIIGFMSVAVMFLLFRLSMVCGNLASVFDFGEEVGAVVNPMLIGLDFTPVVMLGAMLMSLAESDEHETAVGWRRFRMTLPVSPWKYALAKFTFVAIILAAAMVLGIIYMAISCSISGTAFDGRMIGMILVIFTMMLAFAMLMKILVFVFGSMEKAGIAATFISLFAVAPIMFREDRNEAPNLNAMNELFDKAAELAPFMPLIMIGLLGLGYVVTALILKRRER